MTKPNRPLHRQNIHKTTGRADDETQQTPYTDPEKIYKTTDLVEKNIHIELMTKPNRLLHRQNIHKTTELMTRSTDRPLHRRNIDMTYHSRSLPPH